MELIQITKPVIILKVNVSGILDLHKCTQVTSYTIGSECLHLRCCSDVSYRWENSSWRRATQLESSFLRLQIGLTPNSLSPSRPLCSSSFFLWILQGSRSLLLITTHSHLFLLFPPHTLIIRQPMDPLCDCDLPIVPSGGHRGRWSLS